MEPRLPPGYYLELDADLLVLRRRTNADPFVAAFSARGAKKGSVEEAAWEDHLRRPSPGFAEPTA